MELALEFFILDGKLEGKGIEGVYYTYNIHSKQYIL